MDYALSPVARLLQTYIGIFGLTMEMRSPNSTQAQVQLNPLPSGKASYPISQLLTME